MQIGIRIKKLRKSQKMTLSELAEKCGIQIATLSRIENLKMTGTLESHIKISHALAVDVTDLYKDITKKDDLTDHITEDSLTESFEYNDKASYEILASNILSKKMMPVVLRVEKGGRTNPEQNNPGSEKFIFILEGQVIVNINGKDFPLFPNNTLYFDASREHYLVNSGDSVAKVISVVTPVAL